MRPALASLVLVACSLDRSLVPDRDVDAHVTAPDSSMSDAGIMMPDAGMPCTSADESCDGHVAVLCESGSLMRHDCSLAMCVTTSGHPECMSVCMAGEALCDGDATHSLVCNSDGSAQTSTACSRGCTEGLCRPPTACIASTTSLPTWSGSDMTLDLCGGTTTEDFSNTDGCHGHANGSERIVVLEVDHPQRLRLQVLDIADITSVDPVVYVRTQCHDGSSQLGCDDDSGTYLDSQLDLDLPAGEYFVIVDSVNAMFSSCGHVTLAISALP